MRVTRLLVPVRVRMLTARRIVVNVVVVPVVVRVRMIVLNGLVRVLVLMALGHVEPQPDGEERARGEGRRTHRTLPEGPRDRCPDERSRREHGPRARGADGPLRLEVERGGSRRSRRRRTARGPRWPVRRARARATRAREPATPPRREPLSRTRRGSDRDRPAASPRCCRPPTRASPRPPRERPSRPRRRRAPARPAPTSRAPPRSSPAGPRHAGPTARPRGARSKTVKTASRLSRRDAWTPLVRCRPHASATGATSAPSDATAISRGEIRLVRSAARSRSGPGNRREERGASIRRAPWRTDRAATEALHEGRRRPEGDRRGQSEQSARAHGARGGIGSGARRPLGRTIGAPAGTGGLGGVAGHSVHAAEAITGRVSAPQPIGREVENARRFGDAAAVLKNPCCDPRSTGTRPARPRRASDRRKRAPRREANRIPP